MGYQRLHAAGAVCRYRLGMSDHHRRGGPWVARRVLRCLAVTRTRLDASAATSDATERLTSEGPMAQDPPAQGPHMHGAGTPGCTSRHDRPIGDYRGRGPQHHMNPSDGRPDQCSHGRGAYPSMSRPPSYHLGCQCNRQPSCKNRHSAPMAASLLSRANASSCRGHFYKQRLMPRRCGWPPSCPIPRGLMRDDQEERSR